MIFCAIWTIIVQHETLLEKDLKLTNRNEAAGKLRGQYWLTICRVLLIISTFYFWNLADYIRLFFKASTFASININDFEFSS
jgi:hypothetical protein